MNILKLFLQIFKSGFEALASLESAAKAAGTRAKAR